MFRGQLVIQILSANERNGTSVNHAAYYSDRPKKDNPYAYSHIFDFSTKNLYKTIYVCFLPV